MGRDRNPPERHCGGAGVNVVCFTAWARTAGSVIGTL
jgi:hypothetical protein